MCKQCYELLKPSPMPITEGECLDVAESAHRRGKMTGLPNLPFFHNTRKIALAHVATIKMVKEMKQLDDETKGALLSALAGFYNQEQS